MPRVRRRRRVRVASHRELQRLAGTRTEMDGQNRRIDSSGSSASSHGEELMLRVRATLDDDGAPVGWIEIHERHGGPRIGEFRDQRSDVLGQSGPASLRIEVAEPRVDETTGTARHERTPHQLHE